MTNQNLKRKFLIFNCNFDFCSLIFGFIQVGLVLLILFSFSKLVYSSESNNKFGIHLAQPHFQDLKKAAQLVNSSGGDWGYVTLVIQENDRDRKKWQEIFDLARELHLIPIIRLATSPTGASWRRPNPGDAKDWVEFLESLNWVVKNRYIILFNEPNHANEWGGEVDPENYAQVALAFAKALKEKNQDFFVMLAGFDASAPHQPPKYWDEEAFLKSILNFKFEILNFLDGWASHSYPNPAFSGSPWDYGRGTVRTYQWELELLRSFGVNKELPVFITETGWKRDNRYAVFDIENDKVAQNFRIAFEHVWLPDERVKAVTPFVLDYQEEPFLGFSWKKYQSEEFYPQYYLLQSLGKIKGEPEKIEKGEINFDLPKELVEQSTYQFKIKLKNLGQAIWGKDDGYYLIISSIEKKEKIPFDFFFSDFKNIKPFEEREIDFYIKTKPAYFNEDNSKFQTVKIELRKKEINILENDLLNSNWRFKIVKLPSLKFAINLFPKLNERGEDFEIQIFDENENLVFKKGQLRVEQGDGKLREIQNIIPGRKYRLVILKPYYLPRQNFLIFKKVENKIKFKPLVPIDFNQDGKFSFSDLISLIKKPHLFYLLLP